MDSTISPGGTGPEDEQVIDVVRRITADRNGYRRDAEQLAAELEQSPTLDDLDQVEQELLQQLATVRHRKTERAIREHAHQVMVNAAAGLDRVIELTPQHYRAAVEPVAAPVPAPPPGVPDPSARIKAGPISVEALEHGGPLVTATDRTPVERNGAQHERHTGPLEALGWARKTTADDEQGGAA